MHGSYYEKNGFDDSSYESSPPTYTSDPYGFKSQHANDDDNNYDYDISKIKKKKK